jgi:hypothetical protein
MKASNQQEQEPNMFSTPKRPNHPEVILPSECPPPPTMTNIIVADVSAQAAPALPFSSQPLSPSFFSDSEIDRHQQSFHPESSSPKSLDRFFLSAPQHAGFLNPISREATGRTIKLKPRPSRWNFGS